MKFKIRMFYARFPFKSRRYMLFYNMSNMLSKLRVI